MNIKNGWIHVNWRGRGPSSIPQSMKLTPSHSRRATVKRILPQAPASWGPSAETELSATSPSAHKSPSFCHSHTIDSVCDLHFSLIPLGFDLWPSLTLFLLIFPPLFPNLVFSPFCLIFPAPPLPPWVFLWWMAKSFFVVLSLFWGWGSW